MLKNILSSLFVEPAVENVTEPKLVAEPDSRFELPTPAQVDRVVREARRERARVLRSLLTGRGIH